MAKTWDEGATEAAERGPEPAASVGRPAVTPTVGEWRSLVNQAKREAASEAAPLPGEAERAMGELARRYLPRHTALLPGNQLRLLRDGIEAFPAMLDAIRSAQHYVRLETYIFMDDAIGRLVGRALVEAAQRGVKVAVLYDAIGSWKAKERFFAAMRRYGVDVRPWRPFQWGVGLRRFIRRNHRKILIVDGRVAFVGGLNIAAEWAPRGLGAGWRDDVVAIEGPVVQQIERRFGATWWMMVRERLQVRPRAVRPVRIRQRVGDVAATVLSSRRAIHRAYLRAIRRAQERVFIAAGYFVPDRKMLQALRGAVERGVEVTLLLPEKTDHSPVRYASRAFYERLLGWGVKIHLWKESVLHSKTAVVDGTWATVGSFNLERLSLRFNHELNLVFVDPVWGQRLEASVRRDCQECRSLSLDSWKRRPYWQRVLERIFFAFRKVL